MITKHIGFALTLALTSTVFAQDSTSLQQTLAQMQEAGGKNQMSLRAYQWKESVSLTSGDHQAPTRESLCRRWNYSENSARPD